MSDNLSSTRDSYLTSLLDDSNDDSNDDTNEERNRLVEGLKGMSTNELLTSFDIKRISNERKSSIINRIINEISFNIIQEKLCSEDDKKYDLREKCFELELPFEDEDTNDVLNKKIENHVEREYTRYTYDELRELDTNELKTLMDFHYLKIYVHDTAEHLRGILNSFFTEDIPGKTRKMLYDGFIYYNDGFKNSLINQVNFIINGINRDYGTMSNKKLGIKYKICTSLNTINRWKNREVLDPKIWKVFHRRANIYATKEGLILNLSNEKLTAGF